MSLEQVKAGAGSVWTWTAIDADSKLIVSYTLGDRGAATAAEFMKDVASRISNRIQLTTDGHRVYAEAVENAFGADIDYAMLVKIYGASMTIRNPAIALLRASDAALECSLAIPIPSTLARHSWSAVTYPCAWECADSRD